MKRRDRCIAKCAETPNIADKNSSFFSGSKSFHVSNIKGHDQSRRHAKCVEAQKAKEVPTSTPIRLGLRNLNDRFCNILMLVEILLVLPLSTSCCERGFSLMGKIKSDWRSCLSVDILDCLIRVTAEGPPVSDFDPLPALKTWWNSGPRARRPNFNE